MSSQLSTQPATQLVIDPRRLGKGNSGLSEDDLSDIFCIMHPSSLPAYRAASLIYDMTPQHTISLDSEVSIRERNQGPQMDMNTFELAEQGLASCAIALRLSADLKESDGGYRFGRNRTRCDCVLGYGDEVNMISNIHFSIYINEHGVIMLEDQSTNGTAVDGTLLRSKDKENGQAHRHTLQQGSIIVLTVPTPGKDFRFMVRIPQRDEESEMAYQQNLAAYLCRVNNAKLERQAIVAGRAAVPREPVNIFPPPEPKTSSRSRHMKEWRGGHKYNRVNIIGKGAFAVVYKMTDKFNGTPFAAKELEKRRFIKNGILDQKVEMEMKIMKRIHHPNVVQYVEHIDWEDRFYIIMEYVPCGDLGSHINEGGFLPEMTVKAMAIQLLSALNYLHHQGITHRDVKPDNILIASLDPFNVKLTDFGLSKMVDSEETFLRTFCGTLLYCAPEVYSEYREYDDTGRRALRGKDRKALPPQRYDHAVDVWSLAGVLFFALCGNPPFPASNIVNYQELLHKIMAEPLDIRPLQRVGISDSGIRFVRSMLHVRPEFRASISELEETPWITGMEIPPSSMDSSVPGDEIDMAGNDGFVGDDLERGASQLSIKEILDRNNSSDLTEMQGYEVPSSFSTDDDSSGGYSFLENNKENKPRLFGELNISAVGSSGVIPYDQLDLPIPTYNRHNQNSRLSAGNHSFESQSDYPDGIPRGDSEIITPMINAMPPPPARVSSSPASKQHQDSRETRSSSLEGTESQLGLLNMRSHSAALSSFAEVPERSDGDEYTSQRLLDDNPNLQSQIPDTQAPTAQPLASVIAKLLTETSYVRTSLRRPREDDDDNENSWYPSDMPEPKKHKSSRHIEIEVSQRTFWNAADKSTHHYNYPRMTSTEYQAFKDYAQSKGEKFEPGNNTFDTAMKSFKTNRSPSLDPEATTRANSEPLQDEGRHILLRRDDRKFASSANIKGDLLPKTADASLAASPLPEINSENTIKAQPAIMNDFQPPKRILAKLLGTSDSVLPTIAMNITEPFTSWGRGPKNTNCYANSQETRIPIYAFKLLWFKHGVQPNLTSEVSGFQNSVNWEDQNQDMAFYISSKATTGIWVNDVHLPSHDRQNPMTESKYWGELRHGDLITVWRHDRRFNHFIRLRFECHWGMSKETRDESDPFHIVTDARKIADMEQASLTWGKELCEERIRREELEKEMMRQDVTVPTAMPGSSNRLINVSLFVEAATKSSRHVVD